MAWGNLERLFSECGVSGPESPYPLYQSQGMLVGSISGQIQDSLFRVPVQFPLKPSLSS